jgi:glycosyltransferase involved in cell wall biosynthesis
MRQRVIIKWGVSSYFAWGIFGLNLAMNWEADPDVEPVCGVPIPPDQLALDPLRRSVLAPFLDRSAVLGQQIQAMRNVWCEADSPVLLALNVDFQNPPDANGVCLIGRPSVGVVVFESASLAPDAVARAEKLPAIVAASEWNRRVMQAHGLTQVRTLLQGIDPTLFHPAPGSGVLGDRFCVFSGGKLEFRKAQDIVLAAFAIFARRHPDALLVTAWQSPWPQVAATLNQSHLVSDIVFTPEGAVDVTGWAVANGVPPGQVIDLGRIPNGQMAWVLREMDVAVFPNRCEGGTNQVAMECMACGVPVVLAQNTGHLDLIEDDNCYRLEHQGEVAGVGAGFAEISGWGESNVDELVERLEEVFADHTGAAQRGRQGALKLADFTWARTASQMKQVVLGQC